VKKTNIGHHRLHEAEEEAPLERLSLFFFLSLSVGKKYTLQEGTFCAVYITAFSNRLRCIIIVSIITFHQKGERERSEISLARAHNAREQLKRAWERYETKKPPSSSYSYLKLTHIIIIR
jgi:hypothetical protein